MDKTLICDCGFIARAAHGIGLATEVRRHAWEAHGMPLSHNEALVLLFHAELGGASAVPAPPQTTTETEEQ